MPSTTFEIAHLLRARLRRCVDRCRLLRTLVAAAIVFTPTTARLHATVLVVERSTGQTTWFNFSGQDLDVASYTIQSPSQSLLPDNWLSITEHYDADSGGGVDSDDTWFVLGGAPDNLSEATIGTTRLVDQQSVDFGAAWQPGRPEDLTFEFLDAELNDVRTGDVLFVDVLSGDYNSNGLVEQGDLDLVLLNWGEPATPAPDGWLANLPSGTIDQDELDGVLLAWGNTSQLLAPPSPGLLTVLSVPEPASWMLLLAAVPFCLAGRFTHGCQCGSA